MKIFKTKPTSTLALILFCASISCFSQKIKIKKSSFSHEKLSLIEFFDEKGDLVKSIQKYNDQEEQDEWSYRYIRNDKGQIISKTSSIYGSELMKSLYFYKDTILLKETVTSNGKFGIGVNCHAYNYDSLGRLKSRIDIDSLTNETISQLLYSYRNDTITTIKKEELITEITKKYSTFEFDYESIKSIKPRNKEVVDYDIIINYKEDKDGWSHSFKWALFQFILNEVDSREEVFNGIKGYAIRSKWKTVKNQHGHTIESIYSIDDKLFVDRFEYEYY